MTQANHFGPPSADTIDLQDHDAPSAQSHHHRPNPLQINPTTSGDDTNTFAPHQAETLREVAQETAEEELKSPRISWASGGAQAGDISQHDQDLAPGVSDAVARAPGDDSMAPGKQQDELAVSQNGGLVSHDGMDDGDMDGEESDLDDDMMDKISSSPSIDDGGSPCQLPSFNSVPQNTSPGSPPASPCSSEARSSSPYLDLPIYLPLQRIIQKTSRSSAESPIRHHHLPGSCPEILDDPAIDTGTVHNINKAAVQAQQGQKSSKDDNRVEISRGQVTKLQWPVNTSGEDLRSGQQRNRVARRELDEKFTVLENDSDWGDGLVVPYEGSTEEDDDDLSLQSTNSNSRFVDSGWGGECLHDAEDIDFELVYALHTFIATVEGQANATKGDAMVLLDDSNSYWWLVRVVKDSSIGNCHSVVIDCVA